MISKLNEKKVALSLALTSGIIYIVCAVLIAILPTGTMKAFGFLFDGIDINKISSTSVSFTSTILGLIEVVALSLVAGYIFAMIYNKRKEK